MDQIRLSFRSSSRRLLQRGAGRAPPSALPGPGYGGSAYVDTTGWPLTQWRWPGTSGGKTALGAARQERGQCVIRRGVVIDVVILLVVRPGWCGCPAG